MATVRKHPKSKYWYAIVCLPGGKKPRHFSTGLEDRDEALAVAINAEREAKKNIETPHQLRSALNRLADDFVPAVEEEPAAWLEGWAARRKGEVTKGTADAYELTMKEAAKFLRGRSVAAFVALTPRVVTELRDDWAKLPGAE